MHYGTQHCDIVERIVSPPLQVDTFDLLASLQGVLAVVNVCTKEREISVGLGKLDSQRKPYLRSVSFGKATPASFKVFTENRTLSRVSPHRSKALARKLKSRLCE